MTTTKTKKQIRKQDLRVPVLPEERQKIEANAKRAGMTTARFLREVGQGHTIRGVVDELQVRELARINGDLGRIGGLLKLWLSDHPRTRAFGDATIRAVLHKIESSAAEISAGMARIVRPRAEP